MFLSSSAKWNQPKKDIHYSDDHWHGNKLASERIGAEPEENLALYTWNSIDDSVRMIVVNNDKHFRLKLKLLVAERFEVYTLMWTQNLRKMAAVGICVKSSLWDSMKQWRHCRLLSMKSCSVTVSVSPFMKLLINLE